MELDSMIVKLDNGLLVLKINSVVLVFLTTVRHVNGMLIPYCNKCRLNCCTHRFFSYYQFFFCNFFFIDLKDDKFVTQNTEEYANTSFME